MFTIAGRTRFAYDDGRFAGVIAHLHHAEGRPIAFGRRHTTASEARRFADEARWPVVNLDPERKREDRAFWLGYLRGLRNGV